MRAHLGTLSDCDWTLRQQLKKRVLSRTSLVLKALGYHDPEVRVSFIDKNKEILLQVHKGKPVRWQSVVLELQGDGKDNQMLLGVVNKFNPKPGGVLSHENYDNLKKNYSSNYWQEGILILSYCKPDLRLIVIYFKGEVYFRCIRGSELSPLF